MRPERGLFELYADDPERADALVFDRRWNANRRGFLRGASAAAIGVAVGAPLVFPDRFPAGLVPAAFAQTAQSGGPSVLNMQGKAPLIVLQDRPLNAETPTHFLDDDVTPAEKFFVRNNGGLPDAPADPKAWKIRIDGEVDNSLELTLGEIESRFAPVTYQLQLECGGNGRSFFTPEARGNQWGHGAIGCARWTGARLADILKAAGLKPSAKYTAHYGADPHLSGEPGRPTISRGVRLEKALEEHTIVAYRMNDAPIPLLHGGPVRLLVPGWPGSVSHKWLTRITIRDREHDGPGMTGDSYRVARLPMIPGDKSDPANMMVMESMPVRSIVTNIAHGTELAPGTRALSLRGAAWAGDNSVQAVDVSIDFGAHWQRAELRSPVNAYAWQRWTASVTLPSQGYYEIWCRATDSRGAMQPHIAGNWNPQGYGGNPMQRIAVLAKT